MLMSKYKMGVANENSLPQQTQPTCQMSPCLWPLFDDRTCQLFILLVIYQQKLFFNTEIYLLVNLCLIYLLPVACYSPNEMVCIDWSLWTAYRLNRRLNVIIQDVINNLFSIDPANPLLPIHVSKLIQTYSVKTASHIF